MFKCAKPDKGIKQYKTNNTQALTLFDEKLCIHVCNTVYSYVTLLLKKINIKKSINRFTSNPLEHQFGSIRIKTGALKNLRAPLKQVSIEQILKEISDNDLQPLKVAKRTSSFGTTVLNTEFNVSLFSHSGRVI